jgi:hypothetical protein
VSIEPVLGVRHVANYRNSRKTRSVPQACKRHSSASISNYPLPTAFSRVIDKSTDSLCTSDAITNFDAEVSFLICELLAFKIAVDVLREGVSAERFSQPPQALLT